MFTFQGRGTHPQDQQNGHAGKSQDAVPQPRLGDVLEDLLPDLEELPSLEAESQDVFHLGRCYDNRSCWRKTNRDRSRYEVDQETFRQKLYLKKLGRKFITRFSSSFLFYLRLGRELNAHTRGLFISNNQAFQAVWSVQNAR